MRGRVLTAWEALGKVFRVPKCATQTTFMAYTIYVLKRYEYLKHENQTGRTFLSNAVCWLRIKSISLARAVPFMECRVRPFAYLLVMKRAQILPSFVRVTPLNEKKFSGLSSDEVQIVLKELLADHCEPGIITKDAFALAQTDGSMKKQVLSPLNVAKELGWLDRSFLEKDINDINDEATLLPFLN